MVSDSVARCEERAAATMTGLLAGTMDDGVPGHLLYDEALDPPSVTS